MLSYSTFEEFYDIWSNLVKSCLTSFSKSFTNFFFSDGLIFFLGVDQKLATLKEMIWIQLCVVYFDQWMGAFLAFKPSGAKRMLRSMKNPKQVWNPKSCKTKMKKLNCALDIVNKLDNTSASLKSNYNWPFCLYPNGF